MMYFFFILLSILAIISVLGLMYWRTKYNELLAEISSPEFEQSVREALKNEPTQK